MDQDARGAGRVPGRHDARREALRAVLMDREVDRGVADLEHRGRQRVFVVRVGRIVAIDRQPFRCAVAEHTQQRGFVRHVDARQQRIDAPPTVAGRSRA